jgi:hypothetical protein
MDPKSEKPLRLFVNPFAVWTQLALKTGEAIWASVQVAAVRANARKVAVIPTADVPPPKADASVPQPVRLEAKPIQQASKAGRSKAARAKVRSKARTKRRTKR